MRVAPARLGSHLPAMQRVKTQVHGGGGSPRVKWAKLAPPDKAGLSKGPLFLVSEPGEESALEESETLPAGLAELEGAM